MNPVSEQTRIESVYQDRARRLAGTNLYSALNTETLYRIQQRQKAEVSLLKKYGFDHLDGCRILEVGCGSGGILSQLLTYGVQERCLFGTDLLYSRVRGGRDHLNGVSFSCADGQCLPYATGSFDLVLQYTVFSSVLDDTIKQNIAREMLRVTRPDGMILWYDFWLNPSNKQTRGIRPAEIKRLFPRCAFDFHRITLAPPIARRVVPVSWILALLLEKAQIINSHYLVAIRPS